MHILMHPTVTKRKTTDSPSELDSTGRHSSPFVPSNEAKKGKDKLGSHHFLTHSLRAKSGTQANIAFSIESSLTHTSGLRMKSNGDRYPICHPLAKGVRVHMIRPRSWYWGSHENPRGGVPLGIPLVSNACWGQHGRERGSGGMGGGGEAALRSSRFIYDRCVASY